MKQFLSLFFVGLGILGSIEAVVQPQLAKQEMGLVAITPDPASLSSFFVAIDSTYNIRHINDIDLNTAQGKEIAKAIFNACLELSRTHNNADFALHISCKKDRIVIMVFLYASTISQSLIPCQFCERKYFGGDIIEEDATTIAFEKSRPARKPINFLIVPKKHVLNYKDPKCTSEVFINQIRMAQKLSKKLTDHRIDLYVNNGSNAAQSVFHSHMHFHAFGVWK